MQRKPYRLKLTCGLFFALALLNFWGAWGWWEQRVVLEHYNASRALLLSLFPSILWGILFVGLGIATWYQGQKMRLIAAIILIIYMAYQLTWMQSAGGIFSLILVLWTVWALRK